MKASLFHKVVYGPLAAVALAVALCAPGARGAAPAASAARTETPVAALPAESYTWDFQAEASNLLGQIHGLASQLYREAEALQSFARNPRMSRASHAAQLSHMREYINDVGARLARLQEIKHVTAPWQQQAINRIQPLAADVADHTQAAIVHLNNNGNYLFAPSYQEHLEEAMNQAGDLKNNVGNFLAYSSAQQRLDRLQTLVELD